VAVAAAALLPEEELQPVVQLVMAAMEQRHQFQVRQ
jgi:hypothetical protein